LRLRVRRICKAQKTTQSKRVNTLAEKTHHSVLSNWHNLAFSQRTALAGVLKSPLLAYLASESLQVLYNFSLMAGNPRRFAQLPPNLVYCPLILCTLCFALF
jgi:hypothetical protein